MVENRKHDTSVIQVKWNKPPPNFVKLNTYGSAINNPGRIGAGGILRDHKGELIYAYATPLGEGSNNQAEVQAAVLRITWCIQNGYNRVILETNSELLVGWLKHKLRPPWRMIQYITELQKLVQLLDQFQCNHVYREANFSADTLSKYSHEVVNTQQFYSYQQVPHATRGYVKLDKLEMTGFRRRKLKRIKQPP
ncbi:uncharacterized protein LOC129883575 [Solanum dulcamara]|uniref:uncharacterized protein LOC129883575 n=1 Tax=Solanum dulcamara TaxID=45834 RepID=UPI0024851D98|nr:uncharacterized protein LOC129883575 [Solanum dulcamara]